jgi:hypothetical protein
MRKENELSNTSENELVLSDPGELWLDLSVSPEELVRLDPLDISAEMVELAERPELEDWVLRRLPDGPAVGGWP